MTQEEKDLLLRDLCARLPYGVKCKIKGEEGSFKLRNFLHGNSFYAFDFYLKDNMSLSFKTLEEIKPYLFPLSSMTEEQKKEYLSLCEEIPIYDNYYGKYEICDTYYVDTKFSVDWLNKNHFDYRDLIPMGLANDATNLNIY